MFRNQNLITGRIESNGDVIVASETDIVVFNLKKATHYQGIKRGIKELEARINQIKSGIEKYPNLALLKIDLRDVNKKRRTQEWYLITLKDEVVRLAQDFYRSPTQSERMRKAYAHFVNGQFTSTRTVLERDIKDMYDELDALLIEKKYAKTVSDETQCRLKSIANEFLILARLTASAIVGLDAKHQAKQYFEHSIRADRNGENLLAYACYIKGLESIPILEEALLIYRQRAQENPFVYLQDVAVILGLLAKAYHYPERKKHYALYKESVQVLLLLAEQNPHVYLPDLVLALADFTAYSPDSLDSAENILGYYEKFLLLIVQLAEQHPQTYMPNLDLTLAHLVHCHETLDVDKKAAPLLKTLGLLAAQSPLISMGEFNLILHYFQYWRDLFFKDCEIDPLVEQYLQMQTHLAAQNPQYFLPAAMLKLNNATELWHPAMQTNEEALYQKYLQVLTQWTQQTPHTCLPAVGLALANLATCLHFSEKYDLLDGSKQYEDSLLWDFDDAQLFPKATQDLPAESYALAEHISNLAILHIGTSTSTYLFNHSLPVIQQLAVKDWETYEPVLALTLTNQGFAHMAHPDRDSETNAKPLYEAALPLLRKLGEQAPKSYLPVLAMLLNDLAKCCEKEERILYFEESARLLGKLATQDEYTFLSYFVQTIGELASIFVEDEKYNEDYWGHIKVEALYEEYLPLLLKLVNRTTQNFMPENDYDFFYPLITFADYLIATAQFEKGAEILKMTSQIYSKLITWQPEVYIYGFNEIKRLAIII